jgi:hypothetical protein
MIAHKLKHTEKKTPREKIQAVKNTAQKNARKNGAKA